MKTKHTKGAWETRKGFSSDTIEIFAPNPEIEKPFKPSALAVVEADTTEGKANARLMAAAPDLLEACKEGLKQVALNTPIIMKAAVHASAAECDATRAILRSAIAKALGEDHPRQNVKDMRAGVKPKMTRRLPRRRMIRLVRHLWLIISVLDQ